MLRIRTTDQSGRTVLDFHRCALLPARRTEPEAPQGTLHVPEPPLEVAALSAPVDGWRLDACSDRPGALAFDDLSPGQRWAAFGGDVVTSAPELARMTLNLARIHQDRTLAQGERLVYGGHVIGLALAQASRALPSLVTVLAWQECSHLGPVREGDTLHSDLTVEACLPRDEGGGFALLRSRVRHVGERDLPAEVLDWRFVGLLP
jgi:acyl dehydratase